MIVGIFEAPLIYSCPGNLQKVLIDQGVKDHIESLTHLVTPLISGITPGSSTLLSSTNQRVVLYLQVHIPVRNATICSSYVECQDQFSTTTLKC